MERGDKSPVRSRNGPGAAPFWGMPGRVSYSKCLCRVRGLPRPKQGLGFRPKERGDRATTARRPRNYPSIRIQTGDLVYKIN
ncbi:hypothetical protein SAMN02745216_00667 [Desulfatibacillum alkenivorans DSM 16219]|uniref:Uncharacterized protein n=1 Tax=Desulfatibacillum alkenivorans DSM 16219 TaxID=1121393 RepID=A0A1M6EJN4_9BACT|nr:hypothetical protein SAMN02745216_00667 [Desulfatibacillum alkenivorans DSM 16219]